MDYLILYFTILLCAQLSYSLHFKTFNIPQKTSSTTLFAASRGPRGGGGTQLDVKIGNYIYLNHSHCFV